MKAIYAEALIIELMDRGIEGIQTDDWHEIQQTIEDMPPIESETNKISQDDLPEFVGQIIDIFEDFLEEKGVNIENPEKAEVAADGEDPESICILYGTDYGELQSSIESTLMRWNLAEPYSDATTHIK